MFVFLPLSIKTKFPFPVMWYKRVFYLSNSIFFLNLKSFQNRKSG